MKKNFTIALLAALFMNVGQVAKATIVYHEENVTKTQTDNGSQAFNIDMNGDNVIDFILTVFKGDTTVNGISGNGAAVTITAKNNNYVAQGSNVLAPQAQALNSGDNVNSGLTWATDTLVMRFYGTVPPFLNTPTGLGAFAGDADKFLGVKFTVASNTYYGWIRVSVPDISNSFTVKGWAYQNTPNTAIIAGETVSTGVNEKLKASTIIRNIDNILEVEFANPLSGTLHMVNMSGVEVTSVNFNGKSSSVNMQGRISGIYNLVVESSEGSFAKKIYIK